jgi:hypothetical protein
MSEGARIRFSVNGKHVITLSPAKFLEAYLWSGQFSHIPYIVAFPHGDEIRCTLEMPGYSLTTREKIMPIVPKESAQEIANKLFDKLRKTT